MHVRVEGFPCKAALKANSAVCYRSWYTYFMLLSGRSNVSLCLLYSNVHAPRVSDDSDLSLSSLDEPVRACCHWFLWVSGYRSRLKETNRFYDTWPFAAIPAGRICRYLTSWTISFLNIPTWILEKNDLWRFNDLHKLISQRSLRWTIDDRLDGRKDLKRSSISLFIWKSEDASMWLNWPIV